MSRLKTGLVVAAAFAGGFSAQLLMGAVTSHADGPWQRFNAVKISDDKNHEGVQTYINDAQPGQMFFGEDGKPRLELGTYNGAGERGMPVVTLSDNDGHIRMIFRIFGGNQVPVIVMKDNAGRDRLVMGLDLNSPDQEPFLKVTDKDGNTRDIFAK